MSKKKVKYFIYLAKMESSHYDWYGTGDSKKSAVKNLIDFWDSDESSAIVTFEEYANDFNSSVQDFIEGNIHVKKVELNMGWQE